MITLDIDSILAGTHENFTSIDAWLKSDKSEIRALSNEVSPVRLREVVGLNGMFELRFAPSSVASADRADLKTGVYLTEWTNQPDAEGR